MNRLQAELHRLYHALPPQDPASEDAESRLIGADGQVRALVLEVARPADPDAIASLWRGLQDDLELPAPAIAVSGVDAYQLWFSLAQPVPVAQAQAFLDGLRQRYLGQMATSRIGLRPALTATQQVEHAAWVPGLQEASGHWSAYVSPGMASVFAEEPWLERTPNPDAQAELLARLESISPTAFQQALAQLRPAPPAQAPLVASTDQAALATGAPANSTTTAHGHFADPQSFLRAVMNDTTVALPLRIEAAKALLPYIAAQTTAP